MSFNRLSSKKTLRTKPNPDEHHILWLHTEPNAPYSENTASHTPQAVNFDNQDKTLILHETKPSTQLARFNAQIKQVGKNQQGIIISADFSKGNEYLDGVLNGLNKTSTIRELSDIPICIISTTTVNNHTALFSFFKAQTNAMKRPIIFLGSFQDNPHDRAHLHHVITDLIIQQAINKNYYKIHTPEGCLALFRNKHQAKLGLFSRTNIFSDSELKHILFNACRDDKVTNSQTICLALGWIRKTGIENKVELTAFAPLPVRLAYQQREAHPTQLERMEKKRPR